jgi:hypothetical protein
MFAILQNLLLKKYMRSQEALQGADNIWHCRGLIISGTENGNQYRICLSASFRKQMVANEVCGHVTTKSKL